MTTSKGKELLRTANASFFYTTSILQKLLIKINANARQKDGSYKVLIVSDDVGYCHDAYNITKKIIERNLLMKLNMEKYKITRNDKYAYIFKLSKD